jgi:lipoyl-dependent peroxiredoxin
MKTLFTAEATADNSRASHVTTRDELLDVQLANPLEGGSSKSGPTPEHLFAGAYAACYHGALLNASERLGISASGSKIRALVSLNEDDNGGYQLSVELHATLPGLSHASARELMDAAHLTCPYSKLTRGQVEVKLVVD